MMLFIFPNRLKNNQARFIGYGVTASAFEVQMRLLRRRRRNYNNAQLTKKTCKPISRLRNVWGRYDLCWETALALRRYVMSAVCQSNY